MENKWKLRLPDGEMMNSSSERLIEGIHAPGFVIGSFDNVPGTIFTIPDDETMGGEDVTTHSALYDEPEESTPRNVHESNVQKASAFHKHTEGKTVISRVLRTAPVSDEDAVFQRLCSLYPDATIFYFSTAPTGTWIGASPELLLEVKDGMIHTMALAGTRPAGTQEAWDEKNLHEQEIVTQYIINTFISKGLQPETSPLDIRKAGNIEHLLTSIFAPIPEDWNDEKLENLLSALSPTPALGGFPRQDAMQLISKLEQHKRGFYGGYFGHINSCTDFRLNVNLRSARLTPHAAYLFVGGGITASSVPEDEWEETCRKANTVLSALI